MLGLAATTDAIRFAYVGLEEADQGARSWPGRRAPARFPSAGARAAARHGDGALDRPRRVDRRPARLSQTVELDGTDGPAADPRRRVRRGRRHRQRGRGAGSPRSRHAASPPTTSCSCRSRRALRLRRRGGPPHPPHVRVPAGPPGRPPVGAPGRRPHRVHRRGRPLASSRSSTPPASTIPPTSGNFDDPELQGAPLEGLKPIVDHPARGVELHRRRRARHVGRTGSSASASTRARDSSCASSRSRPGGRPVIYRGSISEMVVPYADPSPNRFWQNYFDTGEYLFGRYTNALALGLRLRRRHHVLRRHPRRRARDPAHRRATASACTRRTSARSGSTPTSSPARSEVRRSRRLVISFFTTVGNYDYGFYWYLYLDGTIECEAKLTGILFTSAYPGDAADGIALPVRVARSRPGLGAPVPPAPVLGAARHDRRRRRERRQRDRRRAACRSRPSNPAGNAFTKSVTPIVVREGRRARLADGARQPRLADRVDREDDVARPADVVRALPAPRRPTLLADAVVVDRRARRVRDEEPVRHEVRPRRALRRRRLRQPAPRRRGHPRVHRRRRAARSARMSCSGTRSASRTSRATRTGRSCPWTTPSSRSSRTTSSSATPR